jgi:GNAT superfamily N-acetyltransferase
VIERWEHGSVLLTPTVANFWEYNALRVEAAGVSAQTMHAAADAFFADRGHRKIDVEDEANGEAARPYFAALGWSNERDAVMHRAGPPPPVRHDVREVPLAATRALRTEWSADIEPDGTFAASQEVILARRNARAFMVGELGFTILCRGADAVEIDGLYVTEAARGDGIGSSLIGAALAGTDRAWIVADDEGRARALYERLGFVTAWRSYSFVRAPT